MISRENRTHNFPVEEPPKTSEHVEPNLTPIQKFYVNSNILLTGGTGFLGIILLEKLLFSCPGISKIYLLTRHKKEKDVQSRLDKLFDDVIFSRLKKQYPNFREKIYPVEGDCELPDLGICEQDKQLLAQEVNIIFHLAATVRFDELIKKASFINVRAILGMLKLAHQMPNLKSFVHVSTAFSNCIHKNIKEEVYPCAMEYKKLLDLCESLPNDILSIITPDIIGKYPNTYTFTKQIGESVVNQEGNGLPIVIHRPSVVTPVYSEPVKGWLNGVYNSTGFSIANIMGVMRTMKLNEEVCPNLVPGDRTANSIIASAWDIAENFTKQNNKNQDVPVYHFEASKGAPVNWREYVELGMKYGFLYPSVKMIWYPFFVWCNNYRLYLVLIFLLHTVPAFLGDCVLFCLRKPPMMRKLYGKLNKFSRVLLYFTEKFSFESANMSKLIGRMSDDDKKIFSCELIDVDNDEYFKNCIIFSRVHLIKDPLDTVPEGKKKLRRLYWIHQLTKIILSAFFLWILYCGYTFCCLLFRYVF